MIDNTELKAFAKTKEIDTIGIANIERFANAPAEFHPRNLFPETQSVIVLGIRVLRGLMRALDNGQKIVYNSHGYGGINENFMKVARQAVCKYLEDRGYFAVPVIQWTGSPQQEPLICHRTAAVAAGLGEFGWSKVFLSDEFGPLQRFGIILTDAKIVPDPLKKPHLCDHCMACVKACPGNAISRTEAVEIKIEDQVYRHAKVDMFGCTCAHHGGVPATHPDWQETFDITDLVEKYAKLRRPDADDTEDYVLGLRFAGEVAAKYPHALYSVIGHLGQSSAHCGAKGCFRACLAHLEQKGKLLTKPETKYTGKTTRPTAFVRRDNLGKEVTKE